MRPQILLLAAGASRRFGGDKLAAPFPGGKPVVVCAAETLSAAQHRVLAVVRTGGAAQRLLAGIRGIDITCCPDADLGLGHSLAWGVARSADADGWLVCLGDMPFVRLETVLAVAEALEAGASLCAPVHEGRRGHPVGFSRRWREVLLGLRGDEGARAILRRHGSDLTLVDVDDPGSLRDLDLPEDLPG